MTLVLFYYNNRLYCMTSDNKYSLTIYRTAFYARNPMSHHFFTIMWFKGINECLQKSSLQRIAGLLIVWGTWHKYMIVRFVLLGFYYSYHLTLIWDCWISLDMTDDDELGASGGLRIFILGNEYTYIVASDILNWAVL